MLMAHGKRSEPSPAATGKADWVSAAGRVRGPQVVSTTRAPARANYNAIGLTDRLGNEAQKYAYTPYGQVHANGPAAGAT